MNSFNNVFNNQRNTTQKKEYNQLRRADTTSFLHVFLLLAMAGLQLVINDGYNAQGRGDEVAETGCSSLLHRCFLRRISCRFFLCVHCFC
ncbi:hypothetical protein Droror1_Dr00006490 [Drosera rotundifolia]